MGGCYEKSKWDKETRTKSGTAPNLDDSFCVFEKVMLPKIGLRTVKKDKLELYDKEKKTLYLPTWGEADVDTGAKKGFDIDQ